MEVRLRNPRPPVEPHNLNRLPAQRLNPMFPSMLRQFHGQMSNLDDVRLAIAQAKWDLVDLEKSVAMTFGGRGMDKIEETVCLFLLAR